MSKTHYRICENSIKRRGKKSIKPKRKLERVCLLCVESQNVKITHLTTFIICSFISHSQSSRIPMPIVILDLRLLWSLSPVLLFLFSYTLSLSLSIGKTVNGKNVITFRMKKLHVNSHSLWQSYMSKANNPLMPF